MGDAKIVYDEEFGRNTFKKELSGKVIHSVRNGNLTCEDGSTIPDDTREAYATKKEMDIIISNYYRYYRTFTLSGIVDSHEGSVDWIIPKKGEIGPSLAFNVRLDEKKAKEEVQALIAGIRAKAVPQRWLITPDSAPKNIIAILEENGFRNLSDEASEPEPAMLLKKGDFHPYFSEDNGIVCRKVQSKEDFQAWIKVVNTALHGWDMIDADHYYTWVRNGHLNIYLGEIDKVPVSTAATIQTGDAASLEFVSTLEEYRRRKAAATVCSKALNELLANGVKAVTLGACGESVPLYKGLGFRPYFHNIIMEYDLADGEN